MAIFVHLQTHYNRIRSLYLRYERLLMPASLVVGFFLDYFTFTNIEIISALLVQCIYWISVAATITFMYAYDAGRVSARLRYLRLFAPLLFQFLFGGLLGGSFIFYWFSASFWVSWPVIAIFVILMVSNDVFKEYFLKPLVQLGVFSFITFSLLALALPYLMRSLSPWWFVLAGLMSLAATGVFVWLLSKMSGEVRGYAGKIGAAALAVFVVMHILYFANIIPPIPLAVRETQAYHSVRRQGNGYVLQGEPENFWQRIVPGQTMHVRRGERVYVYSSVFSPENLDTVIYHDWQHFNEEDGEWVTADRLSFFLTGGRQEGFRGYSWKTAVQPGKWRVFIKTSRGQTLGRVKFTVERVDSAVELWEWIR